MKNKFLEQLEKIDKELSQMTDDQLAELIKDTDLDPKEFEQYAKLEQYILNSKPQETK